MEPFSVTCETCRARLKVRDASLIGEIHACPKCESMVLIAPPAGWIAQKSAAVSSQTARPAAEFAHVATPSEDAAEAFAEAAALAARPVPVAVIENNTVVADAAIPLPGAGLSSLLATIASSKLLVCGLLGTTLFVVGGYALTAYPGGGSTETASSSSSPETPTADVVDTPPVSAMDTSSQPPTAAVAEAADEIAVPVEVVAAKPANEPEDEITAAARAESREPSDNTPVLPEQRTSVETITAPPSPTQESESQDKLPPADSLSNDDRRTPVLKFDPLDFDPSRLSLGGSSTSTTDEASSSVAIDQPDVTDPPAPPDDAAPGGADVLPPPVKLQPTSVRLGPVVPNAADLQGTAKSLGLRIESFTAADMPLQQFVAVVSDMADVPITLDPAALELSGVSPQTVVTVNATGVTLAQLLNNVLSKHRLELGDLSSDIRIRLAGCNDRSTKTHDVADLLEPGAKDAQAIAAIVERFVSPESWQAGGGAGRMQVDYGKLRVDQSKAVHHEIVVFCERLRLARGLPQRTRYPAERLSTTSANREVAAKLTERTTFTFLPWTRLADVVRHWEEQSGVTILIDWSALAEAGISPSTPIACSAVDCAWGEALHEILKPIGLAWWAVDGMSIQITAQDAPAGIVRTEFYLVPKTIADKFASVEAHVESLTRELVELARRTYASGKRPEIQIDSSGRTLIVRGTAAAHRFITMSLTDGEVK